MFDTDSDYLRIETRYLFSSNNEVEFNQQFDSRTFTQFRDQASTILKVRY